MPDNNYALDWESEINNEDAFVLIPEGDYCFTVEKFERGTFDGSDKLPPCKKAIVTLKIHAADTDISITENFLLVSSLEWKLSALFLSVGMKKHGEPLRMNWAQLTGRTGRCHVYIDKYRKKDGSDGESNKIKKFYAYDDDVNVIQPAQNKAAVYGASLPNSSLSVTTAAHTEQPADNEHREMTPGASRWQTGKF